jgi:hypothetical protein
VSRVPKLIVVIYVAVYAMPLIWGYPYGFLKERLFEQKRAGWVAGLSAAAVPYALLFAETRGYVQPYLA